MNVVFTWPVGWEGAEDVPVRRPPAGPIYAYLLGTTVAAAASAALLVAVGALVAAAGAGATGLLELASLVVFLAAVGLQFAGRVSPLPERHAQVPRRWLTWRSKRATAMAFGLLIGSGGGVLLEFAAAYVVALCCLLAPTPLTGLAIGVVYGLSRGIVLLVTWLADRRGRPRPPWMLLSLHRPQVNLLLGAMALAVGVVEATLVGV